MNTTQLSRIIKTRRKGMALIMVITTVALMAILMVAIFSITQSEYKSTTSFVSGRSAKQLGDEAVAIVQAQIQNGHYDPVGNPKEYTAAAKAFHATQPGMVRVYNADGTFRTAYKLFSSSKMKANGSGAAGEAALLTEDQAPTDWKNYPARYVDLNEPVVRMGLQSGTAAVYFPVIDPRANWNYQGSQTSQGDQVEGFSYSEKTEGGVSYASDVVLPSEAAGNPARLRLPMPVEWMYLLQDGSTGTLDANNTFQGAGGAIPSVDNPIVGRIAFWTDDESCKVNINTASEPTYMGTPFYYHDRDRHWAHYPAASGEYQRYPGHPATVALSAVLAPNIDLDPFSTVSKMSQSDVLDIKEYIYDMAPKLARGGSRAGTLPFVLDDFSSSYGESNVSTLVDASAVRTERLYASVDEMIFKDRDFSQQNGRAPARYPMPGMANRDLFSRQTLERSRFFLTAHSRAPEFTMFGLPRVCMWPVDADESPNNPRRTTFDNIIALCSSMRGSTGSSTSVAKSYIFRRSQAHHPTHDVNGQGTSSDSSLRLEDPHGGLKRNSRLLEYLATQMSELTWPKLDSTGGNSTNFSAKYGSDNVNQLAIQFFDYIRCTNLYDGVLARGNDGRAGYNVANGNAYGGTQRYVLRDGVRKQFYTYTEPRLTPPARAIQGNQNNRDISDNAGVMPGHGQVTPAVWTAKNGNTYRGFGRSFTLSEVGLQFICTADGLNDQFALEFGPGKVKSGGGSAPRVDPSFDIISGNIGQGQESNWVVAYPGMTPPPIYTSQNGDKSARWYSNFPPYPTPGRYGDVVDSTHPEWHPSKHPGYDPANWNMTLKQDTPLTTSQKRVQAIFLMEAFCPSLGWTKFFPEWTIRLNGAYISNIMLGGERLFETSGDVILKSDGNIFEVGNVHSVGGHSGPAGFAGGRHGRGEGLLLDDTGYSSNNPSGHNTLNTFGLTSKFFTVDRAQNMKVTFPSGPLKIDLYDTHFWESVKDTPVQTFYVNLSTASTTSVPTPGLVGAYDNPGSGVYPYLNISEDKFGRKTYTRSRQGPHYWVYNNRGCIGQMVGAVNPNYPDGGLYLFGPNPVDANGPQSRLSQALKGRLDTTAAAFQEPLGAAEQPFGIIPDAVSDVTRTFVPTMGDYRIVAVAPNNAPTTYWNPHPGWTTGSTSLRQIHSFTNYDGHTVPGQRLAVPPTTTGNFGTANTSLQLVQGALYNVDANNNTIQPTSGSYNFRQPDLPGDTNWAKAAQSFGDFDTGLSNAREGPYINKPDEGNYYAGYDTRFSTTKYYRSGYFYNTWRNTDDWRSGVYMTPNRLISSPVLFGSMPTQVWKGGNIPASASPATTDYKPWQTLLFRPHTDYPSVTNSKSKHPGEYNPKDHLLLDMFFMPVVEPYAISEPLSVAGRVNMNYQIMPFTHITRATGMHAVMKGEFITAVPLQHVTKAKAFKPTNGGSVWDNFLNEKDDGIYWHRPIDVEETLRQFDERFASNSGVNVNSRGLFRTPGQICELYLIPESRTGTLTVNPTKPMTSPATRKTQMASFWEKHRVTGDNVRERPYSNLYSRLTTRSNTFRVHVRAQVLRKARSTSPTKFDPAKDAVLSEYRGSTLIERYIDPNDTASIPDYALSGSPLSETPLESFYRFRALETKRFSP
ncbi:Verru_Chthon cassette protein A [Prosthecobacter sp.]|uniref:Verru_Chthon cassette protein A n=1 Tax=Prosthecobacter sp. TaxID=1965333 RepID=UPI001E136740|nr:Verru_Chthon cassette protein A [Prosthecobacter sp.]MCB1275000.1 Verru_Chthon cassette protein A [Prosthecobacter sp.]